MRGTESALRQCMEIHWHNPDAVGEQDRDRTEHRLRRLAAEREGDLIDIWIDLQENPHHRHGGDEAVIRCQARDAELVSRRKADEAGLALREALAAFEREVHELRGRRTHARVERPAPPPHLGVIDHIQRDDGFGFLLTDAGDRVYFHRNAVRPELGFDALREGDRVALELEAGEKGLQATVVEPPPPDAPRP